jgi:hypothetical protein
MFAADHHSFDVQGLVWYYCWFLRGSHPSWVSVVVVRRAEKSAPLTGPLGLGLWDQVELR